LSYGMALWKLTQEALSYNIGQDACYTGWGFLYGSSHVGLVVDIAVLGQVFITLFTRAHQWSLPLHET
jgi:hypothetical protein